MLRGVGIYSECIEQPWRRSLNTDPLGLGAETLVEAGVSGEAEVGLLRCRAVGGGRGEGDGACTHTHTRGWEETSEGPEVWVLCVPSWAAQELAELHMLLSADSEAGVRWAAQKPWAVWRDWELCARLAYAGCR